MHFGVIANQLTELSIGLSSLHHRSESLIISTSIDGGIPKLYRAQIQFRQKATRPPPLNIGQFQASSLEEKLISKSHFILRLVSVWTAGPTLHSMGLG